MRPKIKEYWSRYTAWQRDPMNVLKDPSVIPPQTSPVLAEEQDGETEARHRCANCYSEFDSDHCPNCGQKHDVGRITWGSIWQGVMDLWGLGTRSLPYTLWQLIWRPGYLIGDYIRGRRQMSFPPIKMLVFVALFAYLFINWIDPSNSSDVSHTTRNIEFNSFMNNIEDFFSRHYDLAAVAICSFFILPTYFIYRYSPRCTRHTLPEGFFIQIYNAVVMLMCLVIIYCFDYFNLSNDTLFGILLLFLVYIEYRVYLQLFGYSYWGTLWRFVLMLLAAVALMLIVAVSAFCVFLAQDGQWSQFVSRIMLRFLPFTATFVGILAFTHWVNVHSFKQADDEPGETTHDAIETVLPDAKSQK